MKSSHSDDLSNIAHQQELDIYQNLKLPTNKNFGDGYLYESFVISHLVDTLLKIPNTQYHRNANYSLKINTQQNIEGEINLAVSNISGKNQEPYT